MSAVEDYFIYLFSDYLTLLWILMLVNCLEHGGGESEDVERLLIMEPLNQNPYTVEIDGEIRIKCVASGFVEEVKVSF